MRLSNIAHLYVVRLKARVVLVQELFAVLGIAVGVALLFASQVASTSLNGSVAQLTNGVVGQATYQLKARGPEGFAESLAGEVQRLPGVGAVVPVLESPATVSGPRGSRMVDLVATDPRYVHLAGPLLRHFETSPQLSHSRVLALPASISSRIGIGPLEIVDLQIGGRMVRTLVGLELTARSIGALADSPIALTSLTYAQQLTGMQGRITRLLVQVIPGGEREAHAELVRLAAGRLNVEPANYEATLFRQAAAPVNQSTQTFAAICALVGFMFAYCSMLLTTDLRRGLVRELRRGGATRTETVRTLLFDALVLATIAGVVGLALGDVLSLVAFSSPPGFLASAFPVGSERIVTWESAAIAFGVGATAACVGILPPVRDIWGGTGHATGFRERHAAHWLVFGLFIGGCACIAITIGIFLFAPQSAIIGLVLLMGALLLLLEPAVDIAIACLAYLQGVYGRAAMVLASVELRSPIARIRSLAIAATAAIAVFGSVTIEGARSNLQSGLSRSLGDMASIADLWIAPSGAQGLLATTPISAAISPRLAELPGIDSINQYYAGFLEYGERRIWVIAPPTDASVPIPPSQITEGSIGSATARLRAGGWAVISKTLGTQHHLSIGQAFILPAPRPIRLRVAAMITNLGWPPGAIIVNSNDYVHAWEEPAPGAYNVSLDSGASEARVSREIRRVLGSHSGLVVETPQQRLATQQAAIRQGLSRLTQIAILMLVAGVLATTIAMIAVIWQRRRKFSRMKVQGYEQRTLWLALVCESSVLLGTGCLMGAILGAYGQLLLSHALLVVTGFPVVLSGNVPVAFGSFGLVVLVAAICIAIPGYRAAGVDAYPWPGASQ